MAKLAKETLTLLNNYASGTSADHEQDELRLELRQMRQAALEWNAERSGLISELEQLRHLLSESDQAAALALDRQVASEINRVRGEFAVEADKLHSRIDQLSRTIGENDRERSQLVAQLEEARRSLTDTDQAAAIALEFQVSTALDRERREFTSATEELHREQEELAAERDRVKQELAAVCEQHERLQRQFDEASIQWDKDRAQLVAEHDKTIHDLAAAHEQHQRESAEAGISAANASQRDKAENDKLRQKLSQVLTAFEMERAELVAERDRASRALTEQAEQHRRILSETHEAAERDKAAAIEVVRGELTAEAEKLREEMQQQLAQVATDVRRMTFADLAVDSHEDSDAMERSTRQEDIVPDSVRSEIARVETLIRTISEMIEDEATELSVVIRKNAERAELESYLRGIRFSISE